MRLKQIMSNTYDKKYIKSLLKCICEKNWRNKRVRQMQVKDE